jgi:hypothetical protein
MKDVAVRKATVQSQKDLELKSHVKMYRTNIVVFLFYVFGGVGIIIVGCEDNTNSDTKRTKEKQKLERNPNRNCLHLLADTIILFALP